MESWRRAWQGPGLPVKPFEDIEWVEQHREWISGLLDTSTTSSETAAENYRALQAQWKAMTQGRAAAIADSGSRPAQIGRLVTCGPVLRVARRIGRCRASPDKRGLKSFK